MKAEDVITLLKQKHRKDTCVEQCRMRRSWGADNQPGSWCAHAEGGLWRATNSEEAFYWYRAHIDACNSQSPLMDLWVLPYKWKGGEPICYEVKVSRADLFGDRKFPDYWGACNWFYFAVPNGLVTLEEMNQFPPQCGFMEVNGPSTGLRVMRKPIFMAEPVDPRVFHYILKYRVKIVASRFRELQ